jgi:hypothetical protein
MLIILNPHLSTTITTTIPTFSLSISPCLSLCLFQLDSPSDKENEGSAIQLGAGDAGGHVSSHKAL